MMGSLESDRKSREPSPQEEAIRKEEEQGKPAELSPEEKDRLEKTWKNMKRFRRDLYRVFRSWVEALQLRDEGTHYSHQVYRGWYAEQAKKLRVSESSVRSKLQTAKKWFVERLRAQ